jgi:hypothetical protein
LAPKGCYRGQLLGSVCIQNFNLKVGKRIFGSIRLTWEDDFIIDLKETSSSSSMRLMHPVASYSERSNE